VLDHVGLNVRDYATSRAFYEQALEPLGYRVLMANDQWRAAGFGQGEKPVFWIAEREPYGTGTHVAFTSSDRAAVDRFHAAALAAGGTDNGAPGLREHYHPRYYGAFVLDLDGNNIEAVCHRPE
jgi:catechol 2,3-dioxygenase-like lactoylglutathione lyase family enzyme